MQQQVKLLFSNHINYNLNTNILLIGGVALIGTFCSLILMHTMSSEAYAADDPCLIDDYDDQMEPFNNTVPPPPYNIPPPPYAP